MSKYVMFRFFRETAGRAGQIFEFLIQILCSQKETVYKKVILGSGPPDLDARSVPLQSNMSCVAVALIHGLP